MTVFIPLGLEPWEPSNWRLHNRKEVFSPGGESPGYLSPVLIFCNFVFLFPLEEKSRNTLTMATFTKGPSYGLSAEVKNKVSIYFLIHLYKVSYIELFFFFLPSIQGQVDVAQFNSPGLHFALGSHCLKLVKGGWKILQSYI